MKRKYAQFKKNNETNEISHVDNVPFQKDQQRN